MVDKKEENNSASAIIIIVLVVLFFVICFIISRYVDAFHEGEERFRRSMGEDPNAVFADSDIHCGDRDAEILKQLNQDNWIISCVYYYRDPSRECYTATYVGENPPDRLTRRKYKLEITRCK